MIIPSDIIPVQVNCPIYANDISLLTRQGSRNGHKGVSRYMSGGKKIKSYIFKIDLVYNLSRTAKIVPFILAYQLDTHKRPFSWSIKESGSTVIFVHFFIRVVRLNGV